MEFIDVHVNGSDLYVLVVFGNFLVALFHAFALDTNLVSAGQLINDQTLESESRVWSPVDDEETFSPDFEPISGEVTSFGR